MLLCFLFLHNCSQPMKDFFHEISFRLFDSCCIVVYLRLRISSWIILKLMEHCCDGEHAIINYLSTMEIIRSAYTNIAHFHFLPVISRCFFIITILLHFSLGTYKLSEHGKWRKFVFITFSGTNSSLAASTRAIIEVEMCREVSAHMQLTQTEHWESFFPPYVKCA